MSDNDKHIEKLSTAGTGASDSIDDDAPTGLLSGPPGSLAHEQNTASAELLSSGESPLNADPTHASAANPLLSGEIGDLGSVEGALPADGNKIGVGDLLTPLRPKPKSDSFWSYGPKWMVTIAAIIGIGFWNDYTSKRDAGETALAAEATNTEASAPDSAAEAEMPEGDVAEGSQDTQAQGPAAAVPSPESPEPPTQQQRQFDGPTVAASVRSVPAGATVLYGDGGGESYGQCQTPCTAILPFDEESKRRVVFEFRRDGYQALRIQRYVFSMTPFSVVALPTPAKP